MKDDDDGLLPKQWPEKIEGLPWPTRRISVEQSIANRFGGIRAEYDRAEYDRADGWLLTNWIRLRFECRLARILGLAKTRLILTLIGKRPGGSR